MSAYLTPTADKVRSIIIDCPQYMSSSGGLSHVAAIAAFGVLAEALDEIKEFMTRPVFDITPLLIREPRRAVDEHSIRKIIQVLREDTEMPADVAVGLAQRIATELDL